MYFLWSLKRSNIILVHIYIYLLTIIDEWPAEKVTVTEIVFRMKWVPSFINDTKYCVLKADRSSRMLFSFASTNESLPSYAIYARKIKG